MPISFASLLLGSVAAQSMFLAMFSQAKADTTDTTVPLLPEVVITASPLSNNPNEIAGTVSQVTRAEILQSGGANLADALANVPGVTGTGFAAGASRPVIRGFDASRVRILEDGIGSFDVSDIGPDHGVPIDPLSATSIEVVRGPATLRYGSQAIGGVVNAINNRVPLTLPDKPLSGELTGSYGSVNNEGQGSILLDASAGQFAFHADGFDRSTGDYSIPGGTQPNSYFRGDGYSLGSSYFFGGSRVGGALIHYDSNYGVPSDTTHIIMHQTKGLVGSSFAVNAGAFKTLTVDGGYGDYSHDEAEPDGTVDDTFKDKEWDTRAEALFGQIGVLSSMALGMQLQHRDFSALGAGAEYLLPTQTASQAGFMFGEIPLADLLKVQFGGRIEQIAIKGTTGAGIAKSPSFTPMSGSIGLLYDPSNTVTLGLTFTSAGRAPAVTELFAHGPHDGPNTFETGDADLKTERANSVETSLRVHADDLQIEGSLWGVSFDNFIYGDLTGRTCEHNGSCAFGGPGDLKELFYRQSGATFWGMEAKTTKVLMQSDSGALMGKLHADYVRATLSDGINVPRITPYHLGGGLSWTSDAFDVNTDLTYTGAQNDTGTAETPTKAFFSLEAGLTWRPDVLTGLALSVSGKNLTDSTQRDAVAINKDEVVLQGRSIQLTARYTF
jgi:iron complex outermembrane receptor protein